MTQGHSQQQNNLYGILFMLLNAAAIATQYTAMKTLTSTISSNQVAFLSKVFIFVLILPWVLKDGFAVLKAPNLKLHIVRSFLSISGYLSFMYGLQYIDMVDATAVGYLEQILWVLLGIIYFKEKLTKTKAFVVFTSILGALIVMQPGILDLDENNWPLFLTRASGFNFNIYYIFVILSVIFWSVNCAVVKVLGKVSKTKTQLFYVTLFSSIFAYPIAFFKWGMVEVLGGSFSIWMPTRVIGFSEIGLEMWHLKFIAIIALCYFVHAIAFFKALKYADLSVVTPFEYSRLLFTGVLGYMFFKEVPEFNSYIGYIIIVASGVILVRAEARQSRKLKELETLEIEESFKNV